tara:strand:- start:239 stop:424 length:186 start_codon:yes stop_codon:yes gene_type:complete
MKRIEAFGIYCTMSINGKWHAFNRTDAANYWSTDKTGIKIAEATTADGALANYKKGKFKYA